MSDPRLSMVTDAIGPDEIRSGFSTAIETATERADELSVLGKALVEAANCYESLDMAASTVAHLRDAAEGVDGAQLTLTFAADELEAALDDFNARDGHVAETVADAGNLASKDILVDADGHGTPTTAATAAAPEQLRAADLLADPEDTYAAAAARHRELADWYRDWRDPTDPHNVDQAQWFSAAADVLDAAAAAQEGPMDPTPTADLPDVLGVADDVIIGSDQVQGIGPVPTNLLLIDDPGEQVTSPYSWRGGLFLEVRTPAANKPGDTMAYPILSPDEAEVAAGHLEDLAALAEAGARPAKPSRYAKAAQRIQYMLDERRADLADTIAVGDEEEFPLTTRELLHLLRGADPADTATTTTRKVLAQASADAGGETGAVWIELEPTDGRIAVTGIEGCQDSPDEEFWKPYTAHHTPAGARELASKLRTFATAARNRAKTTTDPTPAATDPPPAENAAPAAPACQLRTDSGDRAEYDPTTATAYLIEADGWRAPMPPSSPTAVAIRLLYLREQIKSGNGDWSDDDARTPLTTLTVRDLLEVAADLGVPTRGNRTRAQLIEHIVAMSVGAARKYRDLRSG